MYFLIKRKLLKLLLKFFLKKLEIIRKEFNFFPIKILKIWKLKIIRKQLKIQIQGLSNKSLVKNP